MMDYYFLSNRINHLEKLIEELMEKLSNQEICNSHSECDRINQNYCFFNEVVE